MNITAHTASDGIVERTFTLDDITGVIWSSESAERTPLILSGHSGGMHKKAPGLVANAHHLVSTRGYTVAAIDAPGHGERPRNAQDQKWADAIHEARESGQTIAPIVAEYNASLVERTVPEWRTTIDALQGLSDIGTDVPIGYGAMTLGVAIGSTLATVEPRIRAAAFGPVLVYDRLVDTARRIDIPVDFTIAWDDEYIDHNDGIALFDACGSTEKSLHACPGTHTRMRGADPDRVGRFFDRYLI